MKKKTIELRFLSDRFLKRVKIHLPSMIRATSPSLRHPQSCGAIRLSPIAPYGLHLTAFIIITISILWSSSSFANKVSKPVISLATETECNCCVIYKIDIFKDGKVHWLGQSYVHEKGDRYKQIAVSKVNALLKRFDEAKFFELPNYGEERRKEHITLFDIAPMVITLNKDGRKNQSNIMEN